MTTLRKPDWLKTDSLGARRSGEMTHLLREHGLCTVCEEARCPNRGECFERGTATFMILGDTCTRNCRFCAVNHGAPLPPDPREPERIAAVAAQLGLKHVVLTTVTRDDLPDGGAAHFAAVIAAIRRRCPEGTTVEALISDLRGDEASLNIILAARPDVLNHNVETVPRLYPTVRPQAVLARSLEVLRRAAEHGLLTKSGFMVGLGESPDEVADLLRSLRAVDVSLVTIGQYMAPSKAHHPVVEYVTPHQFEEYARLARELGFAHAASAPLVRSSYRAEEARIILEKGGHGQSFGAFSNCPTT